VLVAGRRLFLLAVAGFVLATSPGDLAAQLRWTPNRTPSVASAGPLFSADTRRNFEQVTHLSAERTSVGFGNVGPAEMPFVDLDQYMPPSRQELPCSPQLWDWQILPAGIIYPSYLAGSKEPRCSAHIINAKNDGMLLDVVLGTRVGLLRFGSHDPIVPEGWQIDAEGAAEVRLDLPEHVDVRGVDFRAGVPVTYGIGRYRFKLAYYHISSHVGDEFLLKNPGFARLNFSRDVLVIGHMIYLTEMLRIYGEAGWAFKSDVAEPWEFQFGFDYLPRYPTGVAGAPFFAVNAHMRQEVNYGGGLTVQGGWAWRKATDTNLLRVGVHYYNGESTQFSFFDDHEEQIGLGLWYDF
jgi:hypothetical protein